MPSLETGLLPIRQLFSTHTLQPSLQLGSWDADPSTPPPQPLHTQQSILPTPPRLWNLGAWRSPGSNRSSAAAAILLSAHHHQHCWALSSAFCYTLTTKQSNHQTTKASMLHTHESDCVSTANIKVTASKKPVPSLHPHQLWTTDDQRHQGYFWSQELILFAGFSSYCNRTTHIYREQLKQDYGSIQPTFRENVLKSRRKESHFIQRNESEAWPSPALFHIVNLRSSLLIVH